MIKQIKNESICFSETYYGYKIKSYYDAYGTSYDFCRFYTFDKGVVLLYNSLMVVDNECVTDELITIINFLFPVSLEIRSIKGFACSDSYVAKKRVMFEMIPHKSTIEYDDIAVNSEFDSIYTILKNGFGLDDYDAWYADISHRTRHNVAKTFIYDNSVTATEQFEYNDFCFFSHIATSSECRGKGYARQLLYALSSKEAVKNKKCYLFALNHRVSFYQEIGFIPVCEDILYERNN